MRISDWSSDVCSSDLDGRVGAQIDHRDGAVDVGELVVGPVAAVTGRVAAVAAVEVVVAQAADQHGVAAHDQERVVAAAAVDDVGGGVADQRVAQAAAAQILEVPRSEEHTSEIQSLMRLSYAGF